MSMRFPTIDKVRSMIQRERAANPTSIRDRVGNPVRELDLLFWLAISAVVTVKDIRPGGIKMPNGQISNGELTMEIKFPFDASQPQAFLKDFLVIKNPQEVAASAEISREHTEERIRGKVGYPLQDNEQKGGDAGQSGNRQGPGDAG